MISLYISNSIHCVLCFVLQGSSTPIEHGITAWKTYVAQASAESIAVIAHSAGGLVVSGIVSYRDLSWSFLKLNVEILSS